MFALFELEGSKKIKNTGEFNFSSYIIGTYLGLPTNLLASWTQDLEYFVGPYL